MKKELIIHCSDAGYSHGYKEVYRWHVTENGWSDIGYNYLIDTNAILVHCRQLNKKGAHTLGHNNEIGLCLCGLSNSFTNDQLSTLNEFIIENRDSISIIKQHSDYSKSKPYCAGLPAGYMKMLNNLL